MFPGVSTSEIMVVLLVILLLFGSSSIPKYAKLIGRWSREMLKESSA